LKKFAKDSGKILIASIHQPSSQIFNMFDKLLLLCDGKMAYFGEVKNCAQHFASLELPCPANYNLADHICKYHKVHYQLGYSEVLLDLRVNRFQFFILKFYEVVCS